MDTWNYEGYEHLLPDEQRKIVMERDYGPLYTKHKEDIGRSASFKAPNGETYHGIIQWVTKTWAKSGRSRRHYYAQYVILDDQGQTRVTLSEGIFDA